ncbi:syntaxin-17 isoform X1 [Protopterus annectens]|uniref:syntaxin-17 isoform X1 n=1 Tax=Protopterus annectens TaxID=7888 RepID=UPI001CFA6D2B|nr:syntaxin-17 isoform X1 [Protopterus annectens]XP_043945315.1 syntaxin-17 isoform X1 [Protopterus annectens]XP_043945316.1 syntaxin-17 isoform X1 [Protopterus annectens]XP_043945317.1 syntaxin-17 isoform X1 [Protopterus annectens]
MAEDVEKVPLRLLELAIQKFIKVAIPIDLERLKKHQVNIEKYQRCRQWDRLHQEHINAGRTVQQLRANMREMENLCQRVQKEDLIALEKMINPVKEQALAAVAQILKLRSDSDEQLQKRHLIQQEDLEHLSVPRSLTTEEPFCSSGVLSQVHLPLPLIPQDEDAAESWDCLEEDLIGLSSLVHEFSQMVHSQQEKIDSIEDHVSTAAVNVEEGTKNLGKASKYKLAVLPVAGALIGGVVGGPIGLLAGFKVAGVAAAVGGGVLGYTGGKLIQKKKRETIDQDLKQLSSSCPDLKSPTVKNTS